VRYFGDSGQLENRPNDPIIPEHLSDSIDDQFNDARVVCKPDGVPVDWWLRSRGEYHSTAYVDPLGCVCVTVEMLDTVRILSGNHGESEFRGVRPALWLKMGTR
jgi:hypothetical protein